VEHGEQLTIPAGEPAVGRAAAAAEAAARIDVAQVALDVPLAHLDRTFDYAVPPEMAQDAVPGARVSARFAGRDTAGFIVARADGSEHPGRLAPLRRVVSPVPVLTPEVLALARAVADHYAGTLTDVLRLAVPPRHARTEAAVLAGQGTVPGAEGAVPGRGGARANRLRVEATAGAGPAPELAAWQAAWGPYEGGAAFVRRLAAGESPRALWSALPDAPAPPGDLGAAPGGSRRATVAAAVQATLAGGRGSVVVVPESREVARLSAVFDQAGIAHVRLVAEDGPAARYRAFLKVLLGHVQVVVGTRAAAFAPVQDVGLVVLWDDGDDLLAEPRAPYPHALGVLRLRAELAGAGALIGGYARSAAAEQLLEDGWARAVQAARPTVRARTPQVIAPGEADLAREGPAAHARIPHPAWELARSALRAGPVLVQVPRAGYVLVTACARCRTPARCAHCHGPLRIDRPDAPPSCAWCGRHSADWTCPECGGDRLRAGRLGSTRTAEELGRAFPSVPVTISGSTAPGGVLGAVDGAPRLVVATPGAEPEAEGGYAAALLLDAAVTTSRPELWAAEESLRRWMGAAALVRPAPAGGRVMLLGQGAPVPTQALVRWDPAGFAARELAERAALGFPPAAAMASLQGPPGAVAAFLAHLEPALADGGRAVGAPGLSGARPPRPAPSGPGGSAGPGSGGSSALAGPAGSSGALLDAEVLGPVPVEARLSGPGGRPGDDAPNVRAIVRAARSQSGDLSRALARAASARSARKEPGAVRVQIDPSELW
jgi:primosomal protein N' (replication factor Y)